MRRLAILLGLVALIGCGGGGDDPAPSSEESSGKS